MKIKITLLLGIGMMLCNTLFSQRTQEKPCKEGEILVWQTVSNEPRETVSINVRQTKWWNEKCELRIGVDKDQLFKEKEVHFFVCQDTTGEGNTQRSKGVTQGIPDTIINVVNVNVEIPQIVFPQQQSAIEKKDNCPIFWKSQPYVGIVAGWSSDRTHFSNFPVFGGKGGWEFSRWNCRGTFLRYSLAYVSFPNQFSRETGCGSCDLQKPISANGLQLSAEVGKDFGNGLIFLQANSPLVWFTGEIIYPSPDQGIFVGTSVKLGPAEIGAKIGGFTQNWGTFGFLTIEPFRK